MTVFLRPFLILAVVMWSLTGIIAQTTTTYDPPESVYRSGIDLFEKEKYGAAQEFFSDVIQQIDNPFSPLRISAEFYDACCAVELYNEDAYDKLSEFIQKHPSNSNINRARFQLGRLLHRNRRYHKTIDVFESVNTAELSKSEKSEYYFKSGYSYFKRDDYQKAVDAFNNISGDSKYTSPASYYLAHIDYLRKDFESALLKFDDLSDDPNFRSIAPYYIVQIQFIKGNYSDVIKTAPPLIINATEKRASELNKVLGESYYYLNDYSKALPYLQEYQKSARTGISRKDYYILGYTLYKTGDYKNASGYFQRSTGKTDTLSQFSWYYLADCYLKQDKKKFAMNAFTQAYKMTFDRDIREDALFNHAQLAFELSYDPYNEAVKALRSYLLAYPDSKRNDEAYDFLFRISLATRNFKDAQEALENIRIKGVDYKKNFQKITYYRGIELFNQFLYEQAGEMFKKAIEYDLDKEITAESKFWLAESFYRQANYWAAKKYYLEFLSTAGAKSLDVYNLANYNLGYVFFNRKEYNGSIYYFKQFIEDKEQKQPVMVADANLRLGDSWFISKGYDNAITYYDKTIDLNAIDVDYAMLQKSRALGVLQRYSEKISVLKNLVSRFPSSTYISEIYYELGNTYLSIRDYENALINFRKIADDYPQSTFAVKSKLKSGLIYYNTGLTDLAVSTFKGVVNDYPGLHEAKEALSSLRNIYVEQGRADEYIDFTNNLSFASVSVSEQDSIFYTSAENQYLNGDLEKAAISLENYLEQFPDGGFRLPANYYLSECYVEAGRPADALKGYEFVIESPNSEFLESALLKAADLSYDLADYDKSLGYFKRLENVTELKDNVRESWYGQMKCLFILEKYDEAIGPAKKLLEVEKLSEKMKLETMIILAKSFEKTNELLLAKGKYRDIVELSQGAAGAEAKYNIAKLEFEIQDYTSSEKTIFELINQYAPYDYWVAKGFILLADIYVENDNRFQAKQTLQSIIDNHEGEELREVARQKLDELSDHVDGPNPSFAEPERDTIDIDGEMIELEEF